MKKNLLVRIILILLLTLACGFISYPSARFNFKLGNFKIDKKFDLVLGLDLSGGSHLVFEADTSKLDTGSKGKALDSLRNIIEKRVNFFGVSEPNVQTSNFEGKDRIIVELPGVNDPKEAVNLIGQTAQLVFAEVQEASPSAIINPTNLTGADLKSADVVFDKNTGKPAISIVFNEEGAKKFEIITGKNIGKPLAIILDNDLVSAPVVNEKITGGQAQISGNFTLEEAKKLEVQLNAGALPIPIKLVEEKTVGATLGADSINKSIKAGIIGLIMVSLFMILLYGKYGLIADIGLIVFGIITLALYKLIPVVLTLPGIAGFLLSVGMAVDSNILIFERLKEETKVRPIYDALEVSFGRAWDSIRDANIATLVTAFILANPLDWSFLNVSGPVRGFAITLALGIGISLFTGIIVTRNLLRLFIKEK
ncbi:protein-export membrane protein SecD [Candidatus Woesebacteria bacterium RIFOXYC1_FULL_31_51]|uniref:Protein translocase subunit SecD n=1 Tax=Candidatus Woesebacteria bacterium GW2011_GWC2_31_9 TaxID=1618586 RepID=A0A0F9Z0G2_9BACT|nr:MAG: protein-export membrane protein SecD, preprotein translocase subunit SecD [Candidatus Woesebacteria bacterium GW2011_GWF1_31_35]KKP23365.1 MAG: Preprotein translocase subunit SecD [Candidatus Woesebacteria bacterium GW2011_GWC1_30_29]KKP26119.1 MAG: Preprotein translocase subunit SecD [Candidatus Woesebacteria bacterium GW2011_GWD1_31_12]KKP27624.1 MAG: Preprotein translocase subunit SecD [Candidatus Woesebacteria bacterium GW2011_GWB1_31_29]KKP32141.1 MAG: Preprotein translocase subuni